MITSLWHLLAFKVSNAIGQDQIWYFTTECYTCGSFILEPVHFFVSSTSKKGILKPQTSVQ